MGKTAGTPTPLLELKGICKTFGEVQVLFGINFQLLEGEVHAILGENGAGKSTLVKIMSGFYQPTSGSLSYQGKQVVLPPNGAAEDMGIVLIHQEFNLAEQLTIEENLFLGREVTQKGMLNKAQMRAKAKEALDILGLDLDVTTRVSDLSVSDKQMVEIAKAMSRNAKLLIMDEPTAVLTSSETKAFFEQVERLRASGVGIIFISHKLDEILQISNRVTVLRDGQWIATHSSKDMTPDSLANLMVGRELSDMFPPKNEPDVDSPVVLSIEKARVPNTISNASFDLRAGEILGFAGLVGSGRTALCEGLIGLRPFSANSVLLNGTEVRFKSLSEANKGGIAYLTKDRKGNGLLVNMPMRPNLTLGSLQLFIKNGLIDEKAEEEALDRAVRRFDIRAANMEGNVGNFSGGNQQKLLLAKIMEADPDIIIVDEPTRGIDVGTKQQIYHFIAALAAEGKSFIVISSEMPEIIGLSHRVAVMRSGRLAGILEGTDINEHEIMRYATGLKGDTGYDRNVA